MQPFKAYYDQLMHLSLGKDLHNITSLVLGGDTSSLSTGLSTDPLPLGTLFTFDQEHVLVLSYDVICAAKNSHHGGASMFIVQSHSACMSGTQATTGTNMAHIV